MRRKIKLGQRAKSLPLRFSRLSQSRSVGLYKGRPNQDRAGTPITAIFVLRSFGEQVMPGYFYSAAGDANAHSLRQGGTYPRAMRGAVYRPLAGIEP